MTLIFAKLTKRRKMTIVRLTNREKAMFLNLAFRDELRFTASVIAGDARPSRERGRPRRGVALPLRPRRGVALPLRLRRGVAIPRGATPRIMPQSRREICYNTRMEYTAEVNVLGVRAKVADTFARRARGLIGRPPPGPEEGLLIPRCNAIHTLFMKYPIDATFLDREDRVVKVVRGIRPWRLLVWGGWRAVKVLETASVAPRRTSGERPMVI